MKRKLISEVRKMQKIAGILKEDIGMFEAGKKSGMPKGTVLTFISDTGDIEEDSGTVEQEAKKVANYYKSSGYEDLKVRKPVQDFAVISAGGNIIYIVGPSAPDASEIYSLYKSGDDDAAFEIAEELEIENTVQGWVRHLYSTATPEQLNKLIDIYQDQMDNEGMTDAREFFRNLIDSSDPDAIIDLDDLDQYKGYGL